MLPTTDGEELPVAASCGLLNAILPESLAETVLGAVLPAVRGLPVAPLPQPQPASRAAASCGLTAHHNARACSPTYDVPQCTASTSIAGSTSESDAEMIFLAGLPEQFLP
jgi:hypothetical protein